MGNYFETNESNSHLKAKEKLFDLIVSKRIEIVDQHGNSYEIFKGKDETEFLHIESFVMDYSNQALFSNEKPPCQQHLNDHNKKGLCEAKGYYGAYKELPCERCVSINFRRHIKNSSIYASYRPDVAFGYQGIHKIWLEIKNENPCSINKIEFCKKNDIVLLEISDTDVLKFKDYNGRLIFNKLEEYIETPNLYKDIDIVLKHIDKKLKVDLFVDYKEVNNMFIGMPSMDGFFSARNYIKFRNRLEDKFSIISIEGKELKSHFGVRRKTDGIITKAKYNELLKMNCLSDKATNTEPEIELLENTDSTRMVRCASCKEKEHANKLMRVKSREKRGKYLVKYYHEKCFDNIK